MSSVYVSNFEYRTFEHCTLRLLLFIEFIFIVIVEPYLDFIFYDPGKNW